MLMVGSNEIGGGFVRLAFTDGTRRRMPGEPLTTAEIKAMHNHKRMIAIGRIAVYPPASNGAANATSNVQVVDPKPLERHVVSIGFGRFDVIVGRKINKKSLTKEEAEKLAEI